MSGQFKILESEQAELLKTFDRHLADVESHFTQNQKVSAERSYRCFFDSWNQSVWRISVMTRKQSWGKEEDTQVVSWSNTNTWRNFRILQLRFQPSKRNFANLHSNWKTLSLFTETTKLEEEMRTENFDHSNKPALCNRLEQLLMKLDYT